MKKRTTVFDSYIKTAVDILNAAINTDEGNCIPKRYINCFCECVINLMWRNVSNAIACMELYGDADGFIFNMGGYIDAFYEDDEIRWHGCSENQEIELKKCYPQIVDVFRTAALDIIEMHLRCMVPYDIELACRLNPASECRGTFRNMENIAILCQGVEPTPEDVYEEFLRHIRKVMHYKG